jgi:hypothetical protein
MASVDLQCDLFRRSGSHCNEPCSSIHQLAFTGFATMKASHSLVFLAILFLCSTSVLADDMFQPLDTRTRCIVRLRECLVLIDQKDVDGILEFTADGGASGFKLYPDPDSLPPQLKEELQNVDRFFERNFRSASLLNRAFYKIEFSDLTTAKETVSVINTANDKKGHAKLHSMKIMVEIPAKGPQSVELLFLEIAEDIYWIPIGW